MRPISGQPGLYLADFSVPAPLPPPPYTWSVPTGQPWVLGAIPQSLRDQARANAQKLDEIKRSADALVREVAWNTDAYVTLVRRIVTSPRDAMLQIGRADLGLLCRGVISNVSQSQILAEGLLANPSATPAQVDHARRLLFTAKDAMVKLDTVLSAARPVTGMRGLGAWQFVLGAALVIVAAVLAYQLVASLQLNLTAVAEAREACRRDAETGQPCSGADYQAYLQRALEAQRRNGSVPNLADLFASVSSLVFWGGLLAVAGLLSYAAWTAEPARKNVQERLRQSTLSGTHRGAHRSTKRFSRA
jgi:hypothetical protein